MSATSTLSEEARRLLNNTAEFLKPAKPGTATKDETGYCVLGALDQAAVNLGFKSSPGGSTPAIAHWAVRSLGVDFGYSLAGLNDKSTTKFPAISAKLQSIMDAAKAAKAAPGS